MDDLLRALDEVLLTELKCPRCKTYMVPPIKLCNNGHSVCNKCTETWANCPKCRCYGFSEIRNVALENIVSRQMYPCANRKSGCPDSFPIGHIPKHQVGCLYGEIKCPFQTNGKCSLKCLKSDMKDHLEKEHVGSLEEISTLRSDLFEDTSVRVLSCFGELFVHHQRKKEDGKFYWVVQLIGTSNEASKYKCEFTLLAAKGIEQISNTFLVRSYSEEWEESFNSGKSFCLDEAVARHFLEENKLNFTATVSSVE